MKLIEAANILGVSLEDITVDSLKQKYKSLIMTWDPEKNKDPKAKTKYFQISEAYKKISTIMEGKDNFRGNDKHEIAAFMKMFMDMVGISEHDSIPSAAAMTFGMMFGQHQNPMDEWSTDEDGEGDYDEDDEDDDEDDEDLNSDENSDDYPSLSNGNTNSWEPQVKQYSNMNLKDEISKAKSDEKRSKLAKKRAEKRKKQKEKEKKLKESPQVEELDDSSDIPMHTLELSSENLDLQIKTCCDRVKSLMLSSIEKGKKDVVEKILATDFKESVPEQISTEVFKQIKAELPIINPFHLCITDVKNVKTSLSDESFNLLIRNKIQIAELFFNCADPLLDPNSVDDTGLSILHKSIVLGDNEYLKFVVNLIIEQANLSVKRITINLNSRCHKKGWAPVHYAIEFANIPALQLLAESGANLLATSATDKRITPLELAKAKVKSASDPSSKSLAQSVQDTLSNILASRKSKDQAKKLPNSQGAVEQISQIPTTPSKNDSSTPDKLKANDLTPLSSSKSEKKKKKNNKAETSATTQSLTSVAPTPSKNDPKPSKNNLSKQDSKKTQAPQQLAVTRDLTLSVASRDEMVDRLLAMGFKESDCLTAISLYGTDIDQAISYLCEGPHDSSLVVPIAPIVPSLSNLKPKQKVQPEPKPIELPETVVELQKSKEELRRINRAWNAKAEDEKKKLELQKKLAEETKLKEALAAKAAPKPEPFVNIENPKVNLPATWASSGGGSSSVKETISNKSNNLSNFAFPPVGASTVESTPGSKTSKSNTKFQNGNQFFSPQTSTTHGNMGNNYYSPAQNSNEYYYSNYYPNNTPLSPTSSILSNTNSSIPVLQNSFGSLSNDISESYLNTGELSAGAKPFVPKNFTPLPPAANPPEIPSPVFTGLTGVVDPGLNSLSANSNILSAITSSPVLAPLESSLSLSGTGLGNGLWSSALPMSSTSLGFSAIGGLVSGPSVTESFLGSSLSLNSNSLNSNYFSNIIDTQTSLGGLGTLGSSAIDHFGFDESLMPDLDSLLSDLPK